jgi:hypothetical protein
MPVRQIKQSYTVVTGSVTSQLNFDSAEFEGSNEWQYLIILEFDWDNEIKSFEVQPLKILYGKKLCGDPREYTPDVLVHFHDGRPPLLIEIKSRKYILKNWKELKPKFRAGIHYAKLNGMRFKIISDKEIFTPFLDNARFLRSFKKQLPPAEDSTLLIHKILKTGRTTPNALLQSITSDIWRQANLIPTLWHLIATRRIGVDIDTKIHMESPIWPLELLEGDE